MKEVAKKTPSKLELSGKPVDSRSFIADVLALRKILTKDDPERIERYVRELEGKALAS